MTEGMHANPMRVLHMEPGDNGAPDFHRLDVHEHRSVSFSDQDLPAVAAVAGRNFLA